MSEPLEFDSDTYHVGEQAFARGISVAEIVKQIDRETADPDADAPYISQEIASNRQIAQDGRDKRGTGLLLGYLNGAAQSIRRVEQLLTTLKIPAESQ